MYVRDKRRRTLGVSGALELKPPRRTQNNGERPPWTHIPASVVFCARALIKQAVLPSSAFTVAVSITGRTGKQKPLSRRATGKRMPRYVTSVFITGRHNGKSFGATAFRNKQSSGSFLFFFFFVF